MKIETIKKWNKIKSTDLNMVSFMDNFYSEKLTLDD